MFPNITTEWWKDSPTKTSPNKKTNCNDDSNGGDNDNATNLNITNNYGSIPSSSSYEPIINNRNIENKNDELFPTSLIEKCMDGICTTITTAPTTDGGYIDGDGFIRTYSNKSSITNDSGRSSVSGNGYSSDSSSVNNEGDDDSDASSYSGEHDWKDDEELEAPHKTLGLLFFDTFRFIATMANFRLIMTQMVPLFLTRMPLLHVTLRIYMTIFSLLNISLEFPDYFPFLNYSPSAPATRTATTAPESTSNASPSSPSSSTPPLQLTNWIPRGIFYIFLSIVCFEQAIVVRALDAERNATNTSRFFDGIFIVLSAWVMLIVGGVYVFFGMCCLQKVMEHVRREEKDRWDEYYERVKERERIEEEEEEREWLLENGGGHEKSDNGLEMSDSGGVGVCERLQRWRRKFQRRRKNGKGLCTQLGFRSVDWKC